MDSGIYYGQWQTQELVRAASQLFFLSDKYKYHTEQILFL
jgi:hypothetical protein